MIPLRRRGIRLRPRPREREGFSLVEVTLALGLTTFSAMVLLSLLCSGVNQAREALDRTVTAQIAQQLIGMAQQTDWSQASELGSTYYYFDETGQLLDGPGNFNAVFSACIQIRSSVDLPADGSNPTNDQVATIRVRVVRDPGHKLSGTPTFDSGGKMRRSEFREFSAFMANNGA